MGDIAAKSQFGWTRLHYYGMAHVPLLSVTNLLMSRESFDMHCNSTSTDEIPALRVGRSQKDPRNPEDLPLQLLEAQSTASLQR